MNKAARPNETNIGDKPILAIFRIAKTARKRENRALFTKAALRRNGRPRSILQDLKIGASVVDF